VIGQSHEVSDVEETSRLERFGIPMTHRYGPGGRCLDRDGRFAG
jgi:hypothetical protein